MARAPRSVSADLKTPASERPLLPQTNWPHRTTEHEEIRMQTLRKEFRSTPTWRKQQIYMDQLRSTMNDGWRRKYYPIVQRHDIAPSSGPGTCFWETTRDMSKREQLANDERNQTAISRAKAAAKEKTLQRSESAPAAPEPPLSPTPSVAEVAAAQAKALLEGEGTGTLSPSGPPGYGGATFVLRRKDHRKNNQRYDEQFRFKNNVVLFGTRYGVI